VILWWIVLVKIVVGEVLLETNVKDVHKTSRPGILAIVVESTAPHLISFLIRRLGDVQGA
jgi:hypothetical protein